MTAPFRRLPDRADPSPAGYRACHASVTVLHQPVRSPELCTRAVDSPVPSRPRGGEASTSQGHSYGIFQKALKRGNVLAAVAAAKELARLSLVDALELTLLIARKDPRRHQRAAARWLQRFLEEHPDATIEEAGWLRPVSSPSPASAH